ncbi:MAG: hypothetical protein M9930_11070 [Anaerolineae bacterium]|nr:hypothetical protein [Anaerolineae bacterium]
MIEDSIALVTELLPGFIVFGGVTFLLATLYLWSTSRRPTRYEGLRYHMEQDKVPQIALAMLLLIGACMVMLSVRTPALIIPIVVVTVAALVSALAVQAALGWWGRLQKPPQPSSSRSVSSAPLPGESPNQTQPTSAESSTQPQQ